MFDNLGTALVQALGFFAVFVFFVYQTLFADRKPKNSKSNTKKTKISDTKESIKKEPKKGLFKYILSSPANFKNDEHYDMLYYKRRLGYGKYVVSSC